MTKRNAEYRIDEHTLQDKEIHSSEENHTKTNQIVAERKIYKIKRDQEPIKSQSTKVNFQLKTKEEIELSKKSSQTFGKNGEANTNEQKSTLSNLFAKNQINSTGTGIFSNIFGTKKQTTNLFALNKNLNQKEEGEGKDGNNLATPSVFSFKATSSALNSNIGLFASNNLSSGSGTNLFGAGGKGGKSLFEKNEENDDEADVDSKELEKQLQQDQNMIVDPSKSKSSYKYENVLTIIKIVKANKFKKDSGDLIQYVDVAIAYDEKTHLHLLTVALAATKNTIYSGILMKGKSTLRKLNQKNQNIEVLAFQIAKQGKDHHQAILSHRIKLQFEKIEEAIEFSEAFLKVVSETLQTLE